MAEAGSAWVSIVPSAKGFGKSLDSQVGPELDKSGAEGGKRFGSGFASSLKGLIGVAVAGTAGVAVAGFLKSSIGAASDLNETLNKSQVIFGKNAASIEKFGNTAAKSLGLSKNEAIEAAASFGDMFSQIGFTSDAAAKLSKSTVQMAADLGSFNNLPTADVAERLSAAFRGEYDSLQTLIPNINAARVQTVALAASGKKNASELTAQEKAAAVLAIVHKDGARAAGDFARTSGGLANQQKILTAQTEDLKAKVGTALLPILAKAALFINSDVIPAVSDFVTGMQDGTGAGGQVAHTIGEIYNAAKPVGTVIKGIALAFDDLPGASQKLIILAGAVLLLKNRFGESIPSVSSFNREAATAAAKTVAIRGGAAAAGVGLAALASSAGGAGTSLGGLATIGAGVAAGFAVGGPWGAAIGGAAGALSVFSHRNDDAKAAQDRLKSSLSGVSGTLNQQTGALTSATRATVAKALADNGAFDSANKVGVSLRDVTSAALGNEAATKRVQDAIKSWVVQQEASGKPTRDTIETVATLTNAIGTSTTALEASRKKLGQEKEALDGLPKLTKVTVNMDTSSFSASLRYVIASMNKIGSLSATAKADLHASGVGANAKGTNNWRGGLTLVGEKGPELINLAKGAQVIPNNKIGDIGPTTGGGASSQIASLDGATITIVDGGHMANSFQGTVTARSNRMVSR